MTAHVALSDAALEAMLVRRAARARPDDLHEKILVAVEEVPQARRPLLAWPRWFTAPVPVFGSMKAVVIVALLLALATGLALVAARWLEILPHPPHHTAVLAPTGINTLSADTGSYTRMVADRSGALWAWGKSGRLVRFDPASGSARAWTVDDDAAFVAASIAPASDGGVWLVGQRTLRLFNGEAFGDVLEVPADLASDLAAATEAPDGSLWAAAADGAVLHWDGSSWSRLDAGRPNPDAVVSSIAVDAAGRVWLGWTQDPAPPDSSWLARHDGTSWTAFDATDAAPLGGPVRQIARLSDGGIWVATAGGLARFDGLRWTDATAGKPGGHDTWSVAEAPDGTVWVASYDLSAQGTSVARLEGGSWTSYGPSDGLPGPNPSGSTAATVVPTRDGVYAATGAGIFTLSGSSWDRVWPVTLGPLDLGWVLAVSRDEVWTWSINGSWHFSGDAWAREPIGPGNERGSVSELTLAPDGTVWAASIDGVWYRRDGRWSMADPGRASTISVDRDGTVWAAGQDAATGLAEVWTLRFDGTTWVRSTAAGCPLPSVSSLAVGPGGVAWVGAGADYSAGGLARFDGQNWEEIRRVAGVEASNADVLGTTPGGDVWVTVQPPGSPRYYARFDGTRWTAVEQPAGTWSEDVAADGTIWTSSERGIALLDGERWIRAYANVPLGASWRVSVAPDGTAFGWTWSWPGVWRFSSQRTLELLEPAATPPATSEQPPVATARLPAPSTTPSPTPIATGSAAPITGTIAFEVFDSQAFNGAIYTIHPDGTGRVRIVDGPCVALEHPAWSPDGTKLAYHCGYGNLDNTDTWVMDVDGSDRVQLTQGGALAPAWSTDGALIAATSATSAVRVMDAHGGNARQVTSGNPEDRFPAWAPDGRILFLRDGDVFAVMPDGSGLAKLTNNGHLIGFALSPDGRTLAATDAEQHRIMLVPATGGGSPVTLVETDFGCIWSSLDWSFDGKALAIGCSYLDTPVGSTIHVVNADGSGLATVPNTGPALDPAWAPTAP